MRRCSRESMRWESVFDLSAGYKRGVGPFASVPSFTSAPPSPLLSFFLLQPFHKGANEKQTTDFGCVPARSGPQEPFRSPRSFALLRSRMPAGPPRVADA